jgi:hypothetical protein
VALVLGSSRGMDLCQGESGSGASLGASIAKSDRMLRHPAMGLVFRGVNCCVLSENDFRFAQFRSLRSVTAEDGFCAWWIPGSIPGD